MRRRGSGAGPVDARRHPDVAVCVLVSSTIGLLLKSSLQKYHAILYYIIEIKFSFSHQLLPSLTAWIFAK